MSRHLDIQMNSFPIAGTFTISRGAKTAAEVIACVLTEGGRRGWGECVPYRRYGETMETVLAQIEAVRPLVEGGISRQELLEAMPPGAARNAVDCALWDLEAKQTGRTVAERLGLAYPRELTTAYTISLGEPDVMAAQTLQYADRALLKIKVGTGDDESRIRAVRAAVSIPVIASGGAGEAADFAPAVRAGADAVLAASVFHFGDLTIGQVKDAMHADGIVVR